MTFMHPCTLEGRRVLVTGGSGFVGSHIVDALVGEGCSEIVVIDNMIRGRPANLSAATLSDRVRLVDGDIRDTRLMQRLVKDVDTVFHQAALRITHCAAEPEEAMSVMVQATFDLLQMCKDAGTRKVVMASSASIYGLAPHFPTPETDPPYDNRTLYGAAKSFGEGLLRSFNDMYGLDYVALRYFNVYGPRMDLHGRYTEVMVRWMERIAAGNAPVVFGDGLQTLDMIHVRDIARANILAAKAPVTDVALNVGSETETSLLDIAFLLSEQMGRTDLKPVHAPQRDVNPVPRRLASTQQAEELLGFQTSIDLKDGLRDLVSWWQNEAVAKQVLEVAS
jgi:UDP-glucose 4-epimerase